MKSPKRRFAVKFVQAKAKANFSAKLAKAMIHVSATNDSGQTEGACFTPYDRDQAEAWLAVMGHPHPGRIISAAARSASRASEEKVAVGADSGPAPVFVQPRSR